MRKRDGDLSVVRSAGTTSGTNTCPTLQHAQTEDLQEVAWSWSSPSRPSSTVFIPSLVQPFLVRDWHCPLHSKKAEAVGLAWE